MRYITKKGGKMPTLEEVAEAKKHWETMQLALEEQQKAEKQAQPENDEKSDREKELEAEIQKLKASSHKAESLTKRFLNLIKSSTSKEKLEEIKDQDESESQKESPEGYVSKKEFLALQEQMKAQQLERDMDNLGVPKDKNSRQYFLHLYIEAQSGDKEPSDDEVNKIVEEVKLMKSLREQAKKPKKKEAVAQKEQETEEESEHQEDPIPINKGTGRKIKGTKSKVTTPQESKSLKQFRNMGSGERALFQQKNPEMYEKLHKMDLAEGYWQERPVGEPFYDSAGGGILGDIRQMP